eukprot:7071725-Alexandrium_andersonii.AAC.1
MGRSPGAETSPEGTSWLAERGARGTGAPAGVGSEGSAAGALGGPGSLRAPPSSSKLAGEVGETIGVGKAGASRWSRTENASRDSSGRGRCVGEGGSLVAAPGAPR